jgi:NAD-dependent deacetylase
MKRKILVFSGAGVSKESGVATFRDSADGLWNDFKVEEVATPHGWMIDPQKVIDFYNMRRKELSNVEPNLAHKIIAELENDFQVTVSTQNVDPLHERAGSTKVIHLHGEISKIRSEINPHYVRPYDRDLKMGDYCPDGGHMRPDVVWFGENLDWDRVIRTQRAAEEADVCIIVGTSMQVAPANQIPWHTKENCLIYYVDPGEVEFSVPSQKRPFFYHIQKPATEGMVEVRKDLEEIFL